MKRGVHQHRLDPKQSNPDEVRFVEAWERENVLGALLTPFEPGVSRCEVMPTERDEEVAATVIQWLGSAVGEAFLRRTLRDTRGHGDTRQLQRAMAVVTWCVGHAQRNDDAGSLRAVLRENGFIE